MEEPWKILLYRTAQGESPVKEFIEDKTPPNEIKTALARLIDHRTRF